MVTYGGRASPPGGPTLHGGPPCTVGRDQFPKSIKSTHPHLPLYDTLVTGMPLPAFYSGPQLPTACCEQPLTAALHCALCFKLEKSSNAVGKERIDQGIRWNIQEGTAAEKKVLRQKNPEICNAPPRRLFISITVNTKWSPDKSMHMMKLTLIVKISHDFPDHYSIISNHS